MRAGLGFVTGSNVRSPLHARTDTSGRPSHPRRARVMGQFQNSVDDSGVPADKTKHREDHHDYDQHDGPQKDPLACRDLLHIRLPDGLSLTPHCRTLALS
jgi:hypothetical protein